MKFTGKVTNISMHEHGGNANLVDTSSSTGTPPTGATHRSVNFSFPKEDTAGWAALIGKTVSVEVKEVV